ncbi:hypothetical protein WJX73_001341 [Symbiochloris irregularis]|uniref:histidine kinase n=1 Tax=Symbiochloris irregularis TaxID=706552 RepID=A0AAW1NTD5_9CHLO
MRAPGAVDASVSKENKQPLLPATDLPSFAFVRAVAAKSEPGPGWKAVVLAAIATAGIFSLGLYLLHGLQTPQSLQIAAAFFDEVPRLYFQISAAAFGTSVCMNALPLIHELSPIKKQAAVIQILIKGVSLVEDFQMGYMDPYMCKDSHDNVMIPARFLHWAISCPLLVWLVVRISDASDKQSASVLITSVTTVCLGASAQIIPWPWRWIVWCMALCSQSNTMYHMWTMMKNVEKETISPEARLGLRLIRWQTIISWQAFPVTDALKETGLVSRNVVELILVIFNFYAKVIFSSAIMYSNFTTAHERHAIREELDAQLSRVNLVEELQRALDAKEEFMSMVSHELRTPLNGLIGLSEAMLDDGPWKLGELGTKYMRTIKTSSIHLASLINDILDAAAASKGTLAIKLERAYLDQIVLDVMEVSAQLAKRNVQLVHNVHPDTPCIIADKKRLTQILFNLVGNALKFTHSGTVVVDVRPAKSGTEVIICVTDTGCGIPAGKHAAIFEPFNQGDSTTTRKYGGTGLGLNIVTRLVAAHNGTISVDSAGAQGRRGTDARSSEDVDMSSLQSSGQDASSPEAHRPPPKSAAVGSSNEDASRDAQIAAAASLLLPEQGAKSRLHGQKSKLQEASGLSRQGPPATDSSKGEVLGSLLERSSRGSGALAKAKSMSVGVKKVLRPTYSEVNGKVLILSIDDEPTNHMVVNEIIRSQGYLLHEELSGQSALKWLATEPVLPDLVLLDCMMPGMDGHEVCKALRKVAPGAVMPIIMLSAKNSEENIVEGLQNGCNDFVSKPIKRSELLARIAAHLRIQADTAWVTTLVQGSMQDNAEAMNILKSILPINIIHRIQEGQRIIGDSHAHVVVLFSDIVGFSQLSSDVPAVEIFMLLTNLYAAFDLHIDKHKVYKVETIGDGYMIAAGHDENEHTEKVGSPVERMLKMAKAMLEVVRTFKSIKGTPLQIRIGIHCGPAFAGVIGSKCPRYCFLGDTVNTASRMESTSFPLAIQVSQAVVDAADKPDTFHPLGARKIKGKGDMPTWLYKAGEWEAARKAVALGLPDFAEAAAMKLQQDLEQLHLRLQEERQARKGDCERAQALSAQLCEAQEALQHARAGAPAEVMARLQAQLQEVRTCLNERKQLLESKIAPPPAIEDARASVSLNGPGASGLNTPSLHEGLVPVDQVWSVSPGVGVLGCLSQVVRVQQGPARRTMVCSPGYSIPQLLRDTGLEVYEEVFKAQHIRLEALHGMGHTDLRDLGIASLGHRHSIMAALHSYLHSYLQIYLRSCDMAAVMHALSQAEGK